MIIIQQEVRNLNSAKKKKLSSVVTKKDRIDYYTLAYHYRSDAMNSYSEKARKEGIKNSSVLLNTKSVEALLGKKRKK